MSFLKRALRHRVNGFSLLEVAMVFTVMMIMALTLQQLFIGFYRDLVKDLHIVMAKAIGFEAEYDLRKKNQGLSSEPFLKEEPLESLTARSRLYPFDPSAPSLLPYDPHSLVQTVTLEDTYTVYLKLNHFDMTHTYLDTTIQSLISPQKPLSELTRGDITLVNGK